MDKNLRDRVEGAVDEYRLSTKFLFQKTIYPSSGIERHQQQGIELWKFNDALCSLFAEREIEARIDELKMFDFQYSKGSTYWTVIKGRLEELEQLQSQLKDQKGEK